MTTQDEGARPGGAGVREALTVGLAALVLCALVVGPERLSSADLYPLSKGDPLASFFPYLVRSFGDAAPELRGPWDPTMGTGLPESHSPFGVCYIPLRCLCLLFPIGLAISLSLVLHHALALLGTYLLLRDSGSSRGASLVAGLVFSLGGFLLFRRPFLLMFHTCVWLPWVLWALERWRRRGAWVWVVAAGTLLALHATAVHLQMVVIGGFVWVPYALWFTTTGEVSGGCRGRFLLGCATACLLGAIGSLPQTLPFLEVSRWSGYGNGYDRPFYVSGSLEYHMLAGLLGPWVYGGSWGVPYAPLRLHLVDCGVFIGVVPLALAFLGLKRTRPSGGEDSLGRFWLALGGLHFILALGRHGMLYMALSWVPIYNLFHIPARHTWAVSLSLAYFAALGWDRIANATAEERTGLTRTLFRGMIATTLLAALAVVLFFRKHTFPPVTYPGFVLPVVSVLLTLLVLGAAIRYRPARPGLLALAVVLTVAELWFNQGSYGLYDVSTAETLDPSNHPEALQWVQRQERESPLPPRCLMDVSFRRELLPDGPAHTAFGPVWGVSLLNSYTQSMPASYHRLLRLESHGVVDIARALYEQRGLSVAGGRYILSREMPAMVAGAGYLVADKGMVTWLDRRNHAVAQIALPPGPQYLVEGTLADGAGGADFTMTMKFDGDEGRSPSGSWNPTELPGGRFYWLPPRQAEAIRLVNCSFVARRSDGTPVEMKEFRIWGVDPHASTVDLPALIERLHSAPRHPYRLAHRCKDGVNVYVNDEARPLACFVREVRAADNPFEAVDRQLAATGPVRDLAVIACPDGESHGWRPDASHRFSQGTARVSATRSDEIHVMTRTDGEGFLVLGVTKSRGWTAEVDGRQVPIHAVDGPLMGIRVPAGEHEVRFSFRPVLIHYGVAVSGMALGGAWLLLGLAALRARRRQADSALTARHARLPGQQDPAAA